MGKALKLQGKIMVPQQMLHLLRGALADAPRAVGAAIYALSAPACLEGHPPFAPAEQTRNRDPRGGLAAPLSLPLVATPYRISEGHEVQK